MAYAEGLDPAAETLERARTRVLEVIRAARRMESAEVAAPLVSADPGRLEGFRRLLALHESDPRAMERLGEIITLFEPRLSERMRHVAETMPDKAFGSIREVLAKRPYRRVHSAALGGGAAAMWSFGREPEALWLHGNATGLMMVLACQHDPMLRDQAFAAGLLHNIGRIALVGAPYAHRPIMGAGARPALEDEPVYVEAAGRLVIRELGLPGDFTQSAIPCGTRPSGASRVALLVGAACHLAHEFGFVDDAGGEPDPTPDPQAMRQMMAAVIDAGGPEWVAAHIGGPLVAARDGFISALEVA